MAREGDLSTSGYKGRHLVFSWKLLAQDATANTSLIHWTLTSAGGDPGIWYSSRNFMVKLQGEVVFERKEQISEMYPDIVIGSGDYTVKHSPNGLAILNAEISASIYYINDVNAVGSKNWTVDPIGDAHEPDIPSTINYVENPFITIYEGNATEFSNQGLGGLPDATVCTVVEELNGMYELEMEYPVHGYHSELLKLRRILLVQPNPFTDPQPFRIYSIKSTIDGIYSVCAEHISYDLTGYVVAPFSSTSVYEAVDWINRKSNSPFNFTTTMATAGEMDIATPASVRSILGGSEVSLLGVYGGEFIFDKFDIKLVSHRGINRGTSITYGKNMTDFEQSVDQANVYTHVHPYWFSEKEGLLELPEKSVATDGTYDYERTLLLDVSREFEEKPTLDDIRDYTRKYIDAYHLGSPNVSIKVSFIELANTLEYSQFKSLESVFLGDFVDIFFPDIGVSTVAQCIKYEFNALTGEYVSVELGDAIGMISDTILSQGEEIKDTPSFGYVEENIQSSASKLEQQIIESTSKITGNLGGNVVIKQDANGNPVEILICDEPDYKLATRIWRWNQSGLGYSDKGYAGPYSLAIDSDGRISADFVTTGKLSANLISGGRIVSEAKTNPSDPYSDPKFMFDLTNGIVKIDELTILAKQIDSMETSGVKKLATENMTVNNDGLTFSRAGSVIINTINEIGMTVSRKESDGSKTVMLKADNNGVIATDLSAKNYMIVADSVRLERFMLDGEPMVGFYWLGGD